MRPLPIASVLWRRRLAALLSAGVLLGIGGLLWLLRDPEPYFAARHGSLATVPVPEYLEQYASIGRRPDTVRHVRVALDWLFAPGSAIRASSAMEDWVARRLTEYPA